MRVSFLVSGFGVWGYVVLLWLGFLLIQGVQGIQTPFVLSRSPPPPLSSPPPLFRLCARSLAAVALGQVSTYSSTDGQAGNLLLGGSVPSMLRLNSAGCEAVILISAGQVSTHPLTAEQARHLPYSCLAGTLASDLTCIP